ncbi:MAG: HAD-IIB family hydrolase [Myxococcota bacterium]
MKPYPLFDPTFDGPVRWVFTDIDDTLTDEGRLGPDAYQSLWALSDFGVRVVVVTGRPAGWCDLIARQWPVFGVIGENGALFYRLHREERFVERKYAVSVETRLRFQERLDAVRHRVLKEVPEAGVAADQPFRLFDLAIDVAEDRGPLSPGDVQRIVQIFEEAGATAKVSSIHVNGWFGDWNKLSMIQKVLGDEDTETAVYVGDSPNDQPAFAAFRRSVGVANVRDFSWPEHGGPMYVAEARGGRGFAQVATRILEMIARQ